MLSKYQRSIGFRDYSDIGLDDVLCIRISAVKVMAKETICQSMPVYKSIQAHRIPRNPRYKNRKYKNPCQDLLCGEKFLSFLLASSSSSRNLNMSIFDHICVIFIPSIRLP